MNERENPGAENTTDLIRLAEDAIGRDEPNDYRIRPTLFHTRLINSVPGLSALLQHSELTETAKRYEEQDARAITIQESFKQLSSRSTWAIFVATVGAAVLASMSTFFTNESGIAIQSLVILLSLSVLVGGIVATMAIYRLNNEHLLRRWMSARAAAESERLGYFNRLMRLAIKSENVNPQILLLCLELFRRYQLAVQQRYYRERGARHYSSRRKTVTIGAVAAAILSVGSCGFGIWASFEAVVLPLAALGTIGAALTIVASRREEINQDERNAERYERTCESLSRIRERHSEVQKVIADGSSEILEKYVAAVHEQLSLEHRQWLADTEEMSSTINELNASLKAIGRQEGIG
ncbi:MAG: hypothetical protein JSW64_06500 [Candidatus Zixiibacteriota bacterium]|nr:MAG: hypothetical protein JSW64_06500 [candidate division Zixibacteria bacterium]